MGARGGGEQERAVGDRLSNSIEQLDLIQNMIGAGGRAPGMHIGPAIARIDDAQARQPKVAHRTRGHADVLAELRLDQNDNGAGESDARFGLVGARSGHLSSLSDAAPEDAGIKLRTKLNQRLTGCPIRSPVRQNFSSKITGLVRPLTLGPKLKGSLREGILRACFGCGYQSQPKRTCKTNPRAGSTARDWEGHMRSRWSLAIAGLVLIVAGGLLAHLTQTSGGIRIQDIRFAGAKGNIMSALLYIPPNATAQTPAPGILAVHGYINSRETQDGFAIEFARRGYVVLALDQTGHGYSDPPAFANGFGGPDGLAHLRSLDIVDKYNIGLEGHSMGGWTVLAAATAMPNDYKSMVLEGSSTGKPFAADGTPGWPRNVALVFAQYEEFSNLMWGVDLARDVTQSPKLWALFGTHAAVEPGKIYGDIALG